MPMVNVSNEDVIALARQLPPLARRALALARLRETNGTASLDDIRQRNRPELAALLQQRGLDIEPMSPEQIDYAIQTICEER